MYKPRGETDRAQSTCVHDRTIGLVLVVAAAACFGTLGIFGKLAIGVGLSTGTLLVWRFAFATACLWALLWAGRRSIRLPRRTAAIEIGLGVVYAGMSVTYFESLAWLSAGIAAIVLFTYPVQVTVAAAIARTEPFTAAKAVGLCCSLVGVWLVVTDGPIAVATIGLVLVAAASICYTAYTMGTRAMVATVDPLVHSGYVFVGVTGTLFAYATATGSIDVPTTVDSWAVILGITAIGTVVPIVLFTEGLVRIDAGSASIASTSEPLTTVLLGIAVLGERVTGQIALGAILICVAVAVTAPPVEAAVRWRFDRAGQFVRRRMGWTEAPIPDGGEPTEQDR
ncbi:DMT family transporter [Halalkalirubrum salinum]|uniref:DMT family transporter n=1 Tax=Halalkalirubrum salinum TaxID=2563889 RepID=UPI0010FBB861|nr:EamA family transporter [Halalkalirubrum salinum]